ncbi:EamA family transporter [Streptosporangiaceae bacterium NEAU-GS5]|nr:EamA family transporter [Streptosporangiaceae bacterium NEAU-GS5]
MRLLLAIISACCFGFSGPMAHFLGAAGLSPLEAVWVRMAGAGLILLAVLSVVKPGALRIPRVQWRFFALYAVVAVAGVQALFFVALTRLPVGVTLLIEYTAPVMVVLWVRFVRAIRLPRTAYLGALIAIVGLTIVVQVWQGVRLDAVGLIVALVAAACCAGYFLMSDNLHVDPLGLVAWGMIGAAVVLLPIVRPWGIPWEVFGGSSTVDGHTMPVAAATGFLIVVATVIAYVTGVLAVRRLSAAIGSTVAMLEVVTGALAAWVLLGEELGAAQIVGGVIVLAGALLAQSATVRPTAVVTPAPHVSRRDAVPSLEA